MWRDTWCATCGSDLSSSCEDDGHDIRGGDVLDAHDRRIAVLEEEAEIDCEAAW